MNENTGSITAIIGDNPLDELDLRPVLWGNHHAHVMDWTGIQASIDERVQILRGVRAAKIVVMNTDSGLNPGRCRELLRLIAAASLSADIACWVWNPSSLDGLDLHDPRQRLVKVYRDDADQIACTRIRIKPGLSPTMLSTLWIQGHLGGIFRPGIT